MPKKYSYEDCYFDQKRSITHNTIICYENWDRKKGYFEEIGYLTYYFSSNNNPYIEMIYVKKDFRREGIVSNLIRELMKIEDVKYDEIEGWDLSHQMLNDGKELKKAFDKKSKNYLIPLSTGRFLSKTYILSNREKEKEREEYIIEVEEDDIADALDYVNCYLKEDYGFKVKRSDLKKKRIIWESPDDFIDPTFFYGKKQGWLLEFDEWRWERVLEDIYNRDFSRILSSFQEKTLNAGVRIDGEFGDGRARAIFFWAIDMAIPIAEFESPYRDLHLKIKEVWGSIDHHKRYLLLLDMGSLEKDLSYLNNKGQRIYDGVYWEKTSLEYRQTILKKIYRLSKGSPLKDKHIKEILLDLDNSIFIGDFC